MQPHEFHSMPEQFEKMDAEARLERKRIKRQERMAYVALASLMFLFALLLEGISSGS